MPTNASMLAAAVVACAVAASTAAVLPAGSCVDKKKSCATFKELYGDDMSICKRLGDSCCFCGGGQLEAAPEAATPQAAAPQAAEPEATSPQPALAAAEAPAAPVDAATEDPRSFSQRSGARLRLLSSAARQVAATPEVATDLRMRKVLGRISKELSKSADIFGKWGQSYEHNLEAQQVGLDLATRDAERQVADLQQELRQAIEEGQQKELAQQQHIASLSANIDTLRGLAQHLPRKAGDNATQANTTQAVLQQPSSKAADVAADVAQANTTQAVLQQPSSKAADVAADVAPAAAPAALPVASLAGSPPDATQPKAPRTFSWAAKRQ